MNETDINDVRTSTDFKGISFSKFKKSDVRKELLNCIINNKIESACNWGAELICAGHYQELWENILLTISKYIHLGNPKLPIYISMRFDSFKDIYVNGYIGNELAMRNNKRIRSLFAEVLSILCLSNKKPAFFLFFSTNINFNSGLSSLEITAKTRAGKPAPEPKSNHFLAL